MKKITFAAILIGVSIGVAFPLAASAELVDRIVPNCQPKQICIEQDTGKIRTAENVCTACDGFKLIQNSLNFIWFNLAIPFAVILFIVAGFLMVVPGSSGEQSTARYTKGKKILTNALIGLAIAFFAWLGVDTIIKAAGGFADRPGPWYKIDCAAPSSSVQLNACPKFEEFAEAEIESVASAQRRLEQNGILIRSSQGIKADGSPCNPGVSGTSCLPCTNKTNPKCTSLDGIREFTISSVISLKNVCAQKTAESCNFYITGGTETGHAEGDISHGAGDKLDIEYVPTSAISTFIKENADNAQNEIKVGRGLIGKRYSFTTGLLAGTSALLEYKLDENGATIRDTSGNPIPDHWDIRFR